MASVAAKVELAPGPLPKHIAIIMDGNGRWAEHNGLSRIEGHAQGAKSVREIVTTAREVGVQALTLYAFSTQNWGRPDAEIAHLMELLFDYLHAERKTIMDNGIRLQGIGELTNLPERVQERLRQLSAESATNSDMVLSLALSYGGQEEIVRACKVLASKVEEGRLRADDIDAELFASQLYTVGLPPVDLLVRTSGELRLSNFLLWQCAYAELVSTDVFWPDFGNEELFACIESFRARERRFGLTGEQARGDSAKC